MSPEAIIIGSGPGGATAAEVLTRAGWSVVIMEKGRNHLLDPDDLTRPAGDYSNDEIKFVSRYFLGPDPLVEPRVFRRSAEEGEHTHVGEVNSIPTTVGGGGTHADGKVPRFARRTSVSSPPTVRRRAPRSATGPSTTPSSSRTTRKSSGRSACPAGRAPTPLPRGGRGRTRCRRGRRCTAQSCRRRPPRKWACTPTRPRRRRTASPTTGARHATTAASVPSSAVPSTPRATRWRC